MWQQCATSPGKNGAPAIGRLSGAGRSPILIGFMSHAHALEPLPIGDSGWRGEIRATFRLAWPLALANLLQMLVHAVDVVFVARLGERELAASALAIALFGLLMWALSGLTGIVAALIAEELGRRRSSSITMAEAKAELAAVQSLSIHDAMIRVNDGPLSSARFYYELLGFDVGESQPAAELNAYWFMRNAKIFSKLADVAKPGDRIVVVYGAGHKHWLEHLVANTPGYELVDAADWLRAH